MLLADFGASKPWFTGRWQPDNAALKDPVLISASGPVAASHRTTKAQGECRIRARDRDTTAP
jgi:hypothetical protein